MSVTDQIKILDRKIKQNEPQYDLDREAAKISAFSSNNLDKYEYLTGEDLDLKPSTVEQAKFEYSPLGKIFNKSLSEEDKKEGLSKRIKNIEGKNEEQLKAIEDQGKKQLEEIKNINVSSKPLKTISYFSTINEEAKELMNNIKVIDDWLKTVQLIWTKTDGKIKYDFSKFRFPLKFASEIDNYDLTLQKAQDNQQELKILMNKLNNNYSPQKKEKRKEKDDTLYSAKKLYAIKNEIINAFKEGIFPYIDGFQEEKTKTDIDEFNKYIVEEEARINKELFIKHFNFQRPSDMLKSLYKVNTNKSNKLVNAINIGLKDFKKEFKEMPEEERKIEKPDNIVKLVEEILSFNKQKQEGQGIKMLTPDQVLSRLPISLAQLQAGNNSEELKNEIRQLLYSLYRSKNMTKQVYNNLMKSI